jgi:aspartate/methionine/tyrosine aminotransferase
MSLFNIDTNFHKQNAFSDLPLMAPDFYKYEKDYIDLIHPVIDIEENFANKYIKQVVGCVLNEKLLNNSDIIPEARAKAKYYLNTLSIKVGAYSESRGILGLRRNLVKIYQKRDNGGKLDEDELYLTNGGNNCYDHVMSFISNPGESVLVPNPGYPLFHYYNTVNGLNNVYYDYNLHNQSIDVILSLSSLMIFKIS